jgi:hypothetical protein
LGITIHRAANERLPCVKILQVVKDSAFDLAGFDRYVEEHGIPEEDYRAAFALCCEPR